MENKIDIHMMYMLITAIDQSAYLNIIYKNDLSEIKLVIINFIITIIY
jgi:hypothetical protein